MIVDKPITKGQKKMIGYQFMQYGIKGETFAWEKLDQYIASGIIDKMIHGSITGGMRELEDHGFTFTKEDWEEAKQD